MDAIHSHLIALHIQDRMERATSERLAREARAQAPSPRRRPRWLHRRRRTAGGFVASVKPR